MMLKNKAVLINQIYLVIIIFNSSSIFLVDTNDVLLLLNFYKKTR